MTGSRTPGVPHREGAASRYRRGDVVLVPFPFSDRLAEKQRPAVVVSIEAYQAAGGDLIIAQLTSRTDAPPRPGDHRLSSWREAGLPLPSLARARLATLHGGRIRRRLGALAPADLAAVEQALRAVLGLDGTH